LVHKLGRKSPRTTKELLDIATNHASGEDAVSALFDRAQGMKAKRDEAAGEGTSRCFEKKKSNKCKGGEYVTAGERKPSKAPEDDSPRFFDDLLEKSCPNHAYPVKHLLKNCGLAKRWFGSNATRGEQKKKPEPEDAAGKEKQGDFPEIDDCLMIFGGLLACKLKRKQKVMRWEVFAAEL
jgi:hypothetical protein